MSDLILLGNLPVLSSRVLQALDTAEVSAVDLLTLDVFEIHRRTGLSVVDVQNLVTDVLAALASGTDGEAKTAAERERDFAFLTTGDKRIDGLLGGGVPSGSLTEVAGESGMGKSQLCLQLAIQVQLPRSMGGFNAGAVYIGTESALATSRLCQIADSLVSDLQTSPPPNIPETDIKTAISVLSTHGDRIHYIHCPDLEAQEHIVTFQLPVILSRQSIGLVILDSITANYRAEFDIPNTPWSRSTRAAQMAQRSKALRKLAGKLKDLAIERNVAVLAVNQVTDNFRTLSQAVGVSTPEDQSLLALDYQALWFDGSIDEFGIQEGMKKPALGLVWTNLITSRIMLARDGDGTARIKVVFSPFAKPGSLVYGIKGEMGLYALDKTVSKMPTGADVGVQNAGLHDTMDKASLDNGFDVAFSDFDIGDGFDSNTQ